MTATKDQPTAAAAFRLLFENHPVPMWVYDLQTLAFLAVNEAAEAEYGYTREEFLRLTIEDIRPAEDVEQLLAHLQQERPAFQRSGQWRHRRQDGNVIDVEITSHTIEFEGRYAALVLAQNVTEQTRVAQALAASEERYRAIFNGVQDAIVVETLDGKILAVNDQACAMYGYTHAEFLTKTVADLKPTGVPALITMAAKSLAAPVETISLRANGERFPVEISGRRQVLDGAEVLLVIVRDVTERKRAEEKLRLQSSALAAAANVIVITDRDGLIQWVNPAFTALTGYLAVEALGKTPRLLKSGYQDLKFYQEMWATILAGKVWHGEIVNRRKDGSLYTEETTITPLLDASGQVTNFIAIKLDTTVRKQHERELEAIAVISLALRAAGSRTEILAVILDQLLTLLNVDGATLSLLDPASGVLTTELGRGVWAPATGLQTPPASGLSAHVLATGKPYLNNEVAHEARLLRPDLLAACRAHAVAPLIAKDQVIGLLEIGSRRPISLHELQLLTSIAALAANAIQRETLQEKIAAQARQMQQIMDTVPEGVVLLDSDGHVLLANPVAARALAMLAGSEDRLTKLGGRPLTEFLTPPLQGSWHELELQDRIFQLIARPIMPSAGEDASLEAHHWVLVISDVTQARERQRYQQAQERLATVGQMAAGIAHDFNNILGTIALYAELLHNAPSLTDRQRGQLNTIRVQADRAAKLIDQILDFSRRSVVKRAPMDLLSLVMELVQLLERTLPEHVQIKVRYDRSAYIINADPTQIQQVVMNLALNARDAMPEGGQLTVTLTSLTVTPRQPAPLPDIGPGHWVLLDVSDTGTGIAPEHLPHIFEPFFTTKEPGKGTGLGLAQVYGIVKQHDGAADVSSQLRVGTTMRIYLPLLATEAVDLQAAPAQELPGGKGETILLVEDNLALQEVTADLLEDLGYHVLRAANGNEALAVLVAQHQQVALVLSDLIMPEMGGQELRLRIQKLYPHIKMIFMTGYALDADPSFGSLRQKTDWIQKPFTIAALATQVQAALNT